MKPITLLLLTFVLAGTSTVAQNTLRPRPMNVQFADTLVAKLGDTSVFQHQVNKFIIGGQWGNSEYRKINQALNHNFDNGGGWSHFQMDAAETDANKLALHHMDTNVVNYLGWKMDWSFFAEDWRVQRQWFRSWIGMRWEPAEDWHTGDAWTPRDSASWPYGFEVTDSGFVPTLPTDSNYRRFVLDKALISATAPVKVLDNCSPRVNLFKHAAHGGKGRRFCAVAVLATLR